MVSYQRGPDRRTDRYEPPIEGPTPEAIQEALDALLTDDPTDTPPVSAVRMLEEARITFPLTIHDRKILRVDITRGHPTHGEMRSDDHVSGYEVEYPVACPEEDCPGETTRYEYTAYHNIAGSIRKWCPVCETTHEEEEWG